MTDVLFENLGAGEYDRAKSVLNKAKHPGFVGRELFFRCATAGVVCIAVIDGVDSGVAMVSKEKLQALSVLTSAQGRGIGVALMARLQPRWVSAIEEKVGFFEKIGYKRFGAPKVGANGKHATQLLERTEAAVTEAAVTEAAVTPSQTESFSLREQLMLSPEARVEAELKILDAMLVQARTAERFDAALKILEAAQVLINQEEARRRRTKGNR